MLTLKPYSLLRFFLDGINQDRQTGAIVIVDEKPHEFSNFSPPSGVAQTNSSREGTSLGCREDVQEFRKKIFESSLSKCTDCHDVLLADWNFPSF